MGLLSGTAVELHSASPYNHIYGPCLAPYVRFVDTTT